MVAPKPMDPAHVVTGTGESPAGLYSLLGLLFLGACVLLLIHCASSSRRKKRRQVENSDVSGEGGGGGEIDVSGQGVNGKGPTKARESQRAQPLKKTSSSKKFPSVTIIITPPSPVTDSRSENNGSVASDDDDRTQNSTTANGRAQNDVTTKHDVTRSHEDAVENGSKVGASTTSLSGIADVNFVTTEEEGGSERGEDSPPKPWTAAPKLSSPDSDSPKSDYCTVVGTKSQVVKL